MDKCRKACSVGDNQLGEHDVLYYALLQKARAVVLAWLLVLLLWSWALLSAVQTPSSTLSVELTGAAPGASGVHPTTVLNSALRLELGSSLEDAFASGVAIQFRGAGRRVPATAGIGLTPVGRQRCAITAWFYSALLRRRWRLSLSRELLSANVLGNSLSQNF